MNRRASHLDPCLSQSRPQLHPAAGVIMEPTRHPPVPGHLRDKNRIPWDDSRPWDHILEASENRFWGVPEDVKIWSIATPRPHSWRTHIYVEYLCRACVSCAQGPPCVLPLTHLTPELSAPCLNHKTLVKVLLCTSTCTNDRL